MVGGGRFIDDCWCTCRISSFTVEDKRALLDSVANLATTLKALEVCCIEYLARRLDFFLSNSVYLNLFVNPEYIRGGRYHVEK